MGQAHFPRRSFKYVYIVILILTLKDLVSQLSVNAHLGFMTLIDGQENAETGRALAWLMFGAWALFVLVAYVELEIFEEKGAPFHTIHRPKQRFWEHVEWGLRFFLVGMVTVKIWEPTTYQQMLFSLAAVAVLLFVWAVLTTLAFKARWTHTDFGLLVLAATSSAIAWFSNNSEREATFGVFILMILAVLTVAAFGVSMMRIAKLIAARRPKAPKSDRGSVDPSSAPAPAA
jgi:hypothetical protein